MTSRTTKRFRDRLAELPEEVRHQASKAYTMFAQDPRHPALHFKCVHQHLPVYSARVSLPYRAVGILDKDEMIWFWIGSHANYERLLATLKVG